MMHRVPAVLPGSRFGVAVVALWLVLLIPLPGFSSVQGDEAPPVMLPALESGQAISLADFQGKVIYLDFWASWCGPCRQSLPLYEQMKSEFPAEAFEIVAINLDESRDDAVRFLEDHPVSYTILMDPAGKSASQWQIQAMPTSFLLDSDGRIIRSWAGFNSSHLDEIENEIRTTLQ